jgi:hypothetical protein
MAHHCYLFRGFLNYFFKYGDWCGRNTGRYWKFENQFARRAAFSHPPLAYAYTWMVGAAAHTAQISMQIVRTVFACRIISRFEDITWPARSPHLAVPNYFLRIYIKSSLHETRPANTDDLK